MGYSNEVLTQMKAVLQQVAELKEEAARLTSKEAVKESFKEAFELLETTLKAAILKASGEAKDAVRQEALNLAVQSAVAEVRAKLSEITAKVVAAVDVNELARSEVIKINAKINELLADAVKKEAAAANFSGVLQNLTQEARGEVEKGKAEFSANLQKANLVLQEGQEAFKNKLQSEVLKRVEASSEGLAREVVESNKSAILRRLDFTEPVAELVKSKESKQILKEELNREAAKAVAAQEFEPLVQSVVKKMVYDEVEDLKDRRYKWYFTRADFAVKNALILLHKELSWAWRFYEIHFYNNDYKPQKHNIFKNI